MFVWAPFRRTKVAVKMHTQLDLRGAIPAFIHISDGKMGDVKVLDILPVEAGAFYVMDRGCLDFGRLFTLHQPDAFFVTRAKRGMNARRVYSSSTDRSTGVNCDQAVRLNGSRRKNYPEQVRRIRFKDPESGKTLVFLTQQYELAAADYRRAVQESLSGGAVLQMDQTSAHRLWPYTVCLIHTASHRRSLANTVQAAQPPVIDINRRILCGASLNSWRSGLRLMAWMMAASSSASLHPPRSMGRNSNFSSCPKHI